MECNKTNLTEYIARRLAEYIFIPKRISYHYATIGFMYNMASEFGIKEHSIFEEVHKTIKVMNTPPRIIVTEEILKEIGIPKFENLNKY